MPHDAKGREILAGDIVLVPFTVKSIQSTEDYCNVDLETVATMPPEHKFKTTLSAVNTRMTLLARKGDDANFSVVSNGAAVELADSKTEPQ